MERYEELSDILGDEWALGGVSENGEDVILERLTNDIIQVTTMQHNGWIRKNIYHEDGTTEEIYEH